MPVASIDKVDDKNNEVRFEGLTRRHHHPPVLERHRVRAEDVRAVAEGRALAILIPGYYSAEACAELTALLLAAKHLWTTYPASTGAEGIGISGTPLYGCFGDEMSEECKDYWEKAPERNRALRAATAPYANPADRVRIELDNEWPGGTSLLRVDGRPAFFGLSRYFESGGELEVHTDRADWDYPCAETLAFSAQLFINIYLSTTSDGGGDLELWDFEVPAQADYERLRAADPNYALDRRLLPEPATTVSIEAGTLVIANASKPHAVSACRGDGQRLSVSGFLGYSGPAAPLRAFS